MLTACLIFLLNSDATFRIVNLNNVSFIKQQKENVVFYMKNKTYFVIKGNTELIKEKIINYSCK